MDGESTTQSHADLGVPHPPAAAVEAELPSQSPTPGEEGDEDDELIEKAQKLMDKVTSSPENPSPSVLHALASLLEIQESRYMEENGHSPDNGRGSHNIGRLGNLVRENDDFFELISSRYLSDTRFKTHVKAAAARLLLSVSLTWIYPDVLEEAILENIKDWVMDETARFSGQDFNWRHDSGKNEASDSEMLKTYSTGLLAVCLASDSQLVEDVLTSGLSSKLMRYLRIRVLGETGTTLKDANHLIESKNVTSASFLRGREEGRGRARQVLDTTHLNDIKINDDRSLDDQGVEINQDRNIGRQALGEECWVGDREPPDGFTDDIYEADSDGQDRWHGPDLGDVKTKFGEVDENGRDDSSRRRLNRGWARSSGKGRVNEGAAEYEQLLVSPGSGSRLGLGRSNRDKSLSKNSDIKKFVDSRKYLSRIHSGSFSLEREDTDECFQDCRVGSKDISYLVRKAVSAAEAEARAANAPEEAVKAAGDSAAEVVKSAALEEYKSTNNEDAAVLAAFKAASTVIDAANVVEVSRNVLSINADSSNPTGVETEITEDVEEYFIPDTETLAQLREKFCIQCLKQLGEYVEVLGPVLHEKGVDVCVTLLQRSSKHKEASKVGMFLPDVMKLISTLAAHRKFAALFVDRDGMQKLLAVPRVAQTFFGLSSCLFTIGSLQGIMERVCALPSDIVHQIVGLAIQLLECSQDQARKNAALFFAAAFVFRAVLDAFDAQDGLQKLLSLLNDAASVRSGNTSGALGRSGLGSLRNDQSPAEVLTSSEKQIAYHACVALRQYFRAHLILLVDSIRPNKTSRSAARNLASVRAANKPLDISNEAIDAVFLQLQKDRKVGPSFVRTRWPAVEKFLDFSGHVIMLELCQAPPFEGYLRDLLQYALGVLHVVTLVPFSRKMIVNATLSNDRVGIAVILDAANSASNYVDPEIIQPALSVLVNLVCPPPSISNKPTLLAQGQHSVSAQTSSGPSMDARDRTALPNQNEQRERSGETSLLDRGNAVFGMQSSIGCSSQAPVPLTPSGLVGDRRISLGAGAGCAGLAAQLEQGYCRAREAVRANNGIKVLLHLLQPRVYSSPVALDCLRALACRVLLGLARDDTIAHILTKLQVGKKLSELIRDSGSQLTGTEQGRWQAELSQVAIELIGIVTSSGRASALAATDAATPALRRIERAAIAAATPITYHSRELLQLMHEHLQASGLAATAATLLKEAQLTPLLPLATPSSLEHQSSTLETSTIQLQWPSGRAPGGFLSGTAKLSLREEESNMKCEWMLSSQKKKPLVFSPTLGLQCTSQLQSRDSQPAAIRKISCTTKVPSTLAGVLETSSEYIPQANLDAGSQFKTPIVLPMKRKLTELKDLGSASFEKRLNTSDHEVRSLISPTPNSVRKSGLLSDIAGFSAPNSNPRDQCGRLTPGGGLTDNLDDSFSHIGQGTPSTQLGLLNGPLPNNSERLTLDSLVVQYLKHQHRQCPTPITTLPPLSLLRPHVCPGPRRSYEAPLNVTSRFATREFRSMYGGIHGNRKDRQFVYSRFRPWRTCRDDAPDSSTLMTCVTFLQDYNRVVVGTHSGELKVFDSDNSNVLECCMSHQYPVTLIQSYLSGETQMMLSSSCKDVHLWDASSFLSTGPMHLFEGCRAAKFSNSGNNFAALSSEPARREILLYDVQTFQLDLKFSDTSASSTGRGHLYSLVHFSPSDTMLLWNGVLWDRRVSGPVHRFDQFTDYGGGGFHPAGNEVIINSEVWDLRKFRLLRSVPSLNQTTITFNARGDVIYAILRRNIEDVMSAVNTRRTKHPLFAAFRTLDATNYSDIATIPVDRCVLDFATEPTDSFAGLITMDDQGEMLSAARVYEIGRRRPTDDDSDPDDAESEEDEDDDDDADEDSLGGDLEVDVDSDGDDDMSNEDEDDSASDLDDDEEDGNFVMDGLEFEAGPGDEDDDDDDEDDEEEREGGRVVESSSSS